MSSARDNIIARLKARRPRQDPVATPSHAPTAAWPMQRRMQRFMERMEAVRASVYPADRRLWTDRLQEICREKALKNLLYGPLSPVGPAIERSWAGQGGLPTLVAFDQGIAHWKQALFYDVAASVTSTRAAIAETGTLVLWPTREEPRSYSLVPPVHIAVLDSRNLHPRFDDLVQQEAWFRGMPTNALLISGPSKTADIEQTLSYGIHGPTELVVIVLQ